MYILLKNTEYKGYITDRFLILDFAVNFDTKKLKKLKINIDKSRGYMYNDYCRVTVTNLILKDVPK